MTLADTLILQKLREGVVSRASFGERHYVRKPSETLAGRQIPDTDMQQWLPDSYGAQMRTGSSAVNFVTKTGRGRGRKTTTTPMLTTQRTAHDDGSYTEKVSMGGPLSRALGSGPLDHRTRSGGIRRHPTGDVFSVEMSRGLLDKGDGEDWKTILGKYGLGHMHEHLTSTGMGPRGPYKLDGEKATYAGFHYQDDPAPAMHVARILSKEPSLKVHVMHHRRFESKDTSLPDVDRVEHHEVGEIDYKRDPTPDGRVTYRHSVHAQLDHAKSTGNPHRCNTGHIQHGRDVCSDISPCSAARKPAP